MGASGQLMRCVLKPTEPFVPNTVEPHLGLDRSLGQVCIDDVRSLPIDRDEGHETAEQTGRGHNYPEIIQCLLQFQARILHKDMIYLNTSMLAFQTSTRVLVLRVPLRFALQIC